MSERLSELTPPVEQIIGKKTVLYSGLTKPLAPYELVPGFWKRTSDPPRVVYLTSLPRAGSTVAKRFLGDHPRIKLTGMSPSHNWWDAWATQRIHYTFRNRVVLDKRTLYIHHLDEIINTFGGHVRLLLLVRDPRDQRLSLRDFSRHQSYPRDESFYDLWAKTYREAIRTVREHQFGNETRFLRYEDLVGHPESIKEQFLEWLGLPADQVSSNYQTQDESILESDDPHEDEAVHRHETVHKNSLRKWKNREDADSMTKSALERASVEMERFQYNPPVLPEKPELITVDSLRKS